MRVSPERYSIPPRVRLNSRHDLLHPHGSQFRLRLGLGASPQIRLRSSLCSLRPLGQLASALRGGSVRRRTSALGALVLSSCGGGDGNTREKRQDGSSAPEQKRSGGLRGTSGWFAKHWRHCWDSTLTGASKTTDTSTTLCPFSVDHTAPRLDRPHGARSREGGTRLAAQFCEEEEFGRGRRRRGRVGSVRGVCEPTNPAHQ
ncbi:hypothetical protein B0H14DRAFT_2767576 [Mycena olivaceomarginata]|nr:hypothetical protein B0H14DRAFT_2767576 [Mycena olivaceomarginata]